jgi:2-polyprenyl-6-methoxyphenol hydroxylase-like FAD-dependent oxidoreductase
VVVVGAGLGGLCLAQGLRKAGIETLVYERDTEPGSRPQGYRITLKSEGAKALRECLPENLYELAVATSLRNPTTMAFVDERLVPKFVKPVPPVTPGADGFGVNRLTMREILLGGLNDIVHFGQRFLRYESTPDGHVRAHFEGGVSVEADLLVGADGTNSAVRAILVPDAVVDGLECAAYGRTPIGPDTLQWLPEILTDSFNRITAPDGAGMAVATCRTREPVATAASRLAPGLALTDQPAYLAWMVTLPDDRLRDANATTVHAAAREVVRSWHPGPGRIIDEANVAATFPVVITTAQPVTPWHHETVTLLGDAIHTMSPGRGEGANVALRDAALLCRTLARVNAGEAPLAVAKRQYEADMLHYGFEAVAASLNQPFGPPRRPSSPAAAVEGFPARSPRSPQQYGR